jgi:nitroreductase
MVERILLAGVQAPSGKNRQPWHFVVAQGAKKREAVELVWGALVDREEQGAELGSSKWTAGCMEQAPVIVLVFYPQSLEDTQTLGLPREWWTIADVSSIGAAIQNMLLAALDLGLGTLWICDVFYAYDRLCQWLGRQDQMIAAIAIGYPDEAPDPRPRRSVEEVTTWLEG